MLNCFSIVSKHFLKNVFFLLRSFFKIYNENSFTSETLNYLSKIIKKIIKLIIINYYQKFNFFKCGTISKFSKITFIEDV